MSTSVAYIGKTYHFTFADGSLQDTGTLLGVVSHAQGYDFHVEAPDGFTLLRKQKILIDGKWLFPEEVDVRDNLPKQPRTSKPTVRIGDRYEFSCDDGENTTVGTLAGTYEDKINSLRFEMMEGRSYWTQININDKWLSANDVTVVQPGGGTVAPKQPRCMNTDLFGNEDSESIRSAETIQSLREENAKQEERIRLLEILIVALEAVLIADEREALIEALRIHAHRYIGENGGAK